MVMQKLISDELNAALCEQIGHEKFNANLYLFLAALLKNKGLDGLAKHFYEQHDEETHHSLMITEILTDLSSPVKIPEIDEVDIQINTVLDLADIYLQREILTTESLDAIKKLAIDENNPVVEEALRDMIHLQRAEYDEATSWSDKAQLTGGNWMNVFIWDLGEK
jgi:ferritin